MSLIKTQKRFNVFENSYKLSIIFSLICILFLGGFLRVHGIGWGLPSQNCYVSYRSDENIYIRSISKMNVAKLDFNPHFFYWGSWHFYELALFLKLSQWAGVFKASSGPEFYYQNPKELTKIFLLGRFLSVIFSLLTIGLVYKIGAILFNSNVGLMSSLLLAIMPAHVVNSHFLKADISVTFWVTLLLFFSVRIFYSGKLKNYVLAGLALGFATGSQYNGLLFSLDILVAHLLRDCKSISPQEIVTHLFDRRLLVAYGVAALTFFISSPYLILAFGEVKPYLSVLLTRSAFSNVESRKNFVLDTLDLISVGMTPAFCVMFILSSLSVLFSMQKKLILVLSAVLPYLSYLIQSGMLATRFQILIYPVACILISQWIRSVFDYLKDSKNLFMIKPVLISVVLVAFVFSISYSFAYDQVLAEKPTQDIVSKWLLNNIPKGSEVGVPEKPFIEKAPTVIHQDFFYAGTHRWEPSFQVKAMEWDVQKLIRTNPEYFVMSDKDGLAIFESQSADQLTISKALFFKKLLERYEIVAVFQKKLKGLNFEFSQRGVTDWDIPFYKFAVLKRKNKGEITRGLYGN